MKSALYALRGEVGTIRRESLRNQEHIVVPVTALVEGVIHPASSPEPELATATEFGKRIGQWNGRPVILDHVWEEGVAVSCNSPDTLEVQQIGVLFNSALDGNRFITEAWINPAFCESVQGGPEMLERILRVESGDEEEHIEVSTGCWVELVPHRGTFRGLNYAGRWSEIRADHLAFLPGGVGACSWRDGCGVRASAQAQEGVLRVCRLAAACREGCAGDCCGRNGQPTASVRSRARRPTYEGTESTRWTRPTFQQAARAYASSQGADGDLPGSVGDAPPAMKRWIAARTLLGDAGAETERDLLFFPVVRFRTGKLNENALRAVLGGRGSSADIPEATIRSAQNMARRLLNEEYDAGLEASEGMDENEILELLERSIDKSMRTTAWPERDWQREGVLHAAASGISDVDLRTAILQQLRKETGDSERPVWIHAVFPDAVIYETISSAGALERSYTMNGDEITLGDEVVDVRPVTRFVPAQQEDNAVDRKERIDALVANEKTSFEEGDREWLTSLSDEQFAKLEPKAETPPAKPDDVEDEPTTLSREQLEAAAKSQGLEVRDPETDEERESRQETLSLHRKRKSDLVDGLAALKDGDESLYERKELEVMSFRELQRLARVAKLDEKTPTAAADFGGRGMPSPTQQDNDKDPLADGPRGLAAQVGKRTEREPGATTH